MLRVHIADEGPRAHYTIAHVVERMLGWPLLIMADRQAWEREAGPKLLYGGEPIAGAYHVPAHGLLTARGLFRGPAPVGEVGGLPVLFPLGEGSDLFAATFLLLSLNEELLPHVTDAHGRMLAMDRTLVQLGLHRTPIIDRWVLRFAERMRAMFPDLPEPRRSYRHWVTVDVDNGMRYLGRPIWRQLGAGAQEMVRGRFADLGRRWRTLTGSGPDPYDGYATWSGRTRAQADRTLFFFLTRGGGRYDHATRARHPRMASRIRELAEEHMAGLHPSYRTSEKAGLLKKEVDTWRAVAGSAPVVSRQHFLRWRLPGTLDELVAAGITEDHSLGFADRTGFVVGTSTPFRWFDPVKDREHPITLVPFAVMDSALQDRMHLSAEEALAEMKAMSDAVRRVNGTFVSVWHDRFLSGEGAWDAWPSVFEALLEHARA
ncbi:MAG: polysaccharide deacetylase family protein [Flavobacteriales bacterium]|nr:polysaccharide deacetylase family protein [Flavobacteriales bacterium]MCB9166058.1 polysaccharide deacetylase family protein [Flavobacteriales bacterium]